MATNYPANSRIRAYGKARIDIAQRNKTSQERQQFWKPPQYSFPFTWGVQWKQCIEYRVDDFAAEVGFFIDIMGFPVNAFDPGYAMFTSPHRDFFFAIVETPPGMESTPPEAFRLQFMVSDILETVQELERRGIEFEQSPSPIQEGSALQIGYFRSPHGICVELWGTVPQARPARSHQEFAPQHDLNSEQDRLVNRNTSTDVSLRIGRGMAAIEEMPAGMQRGFRFKFKTPEQVSTHSTDHQPGIMQNENRFIHDDQEANEFELEEENIEAIGEEGEQEFEEDEDDEFEAILAELNDEDDEEDIQDAEYVDVEEA